MCGVCMGVCLHMLYVRMQMCIYMCVYLCVYVWCACVQMCVQMYMCRCVMTCPASLQHRNSVIDEWSIPYDEIKVLECIGHGPVGEVYKGYWHGDVAIKKFHLPDATADQLDSFKEEASVCFVWMYLCVGLGVCDVWMCL